MKAIALVSGGLDSILATRLIRELGIELVVFNLKTPFCLCDKKGKGGCNSESARLAQALGLEFKSIYVSDEFFRVLEEPHYGFGSNMNPCIDCRILLFRKAKELMLEVGAYFIITGEVLGQRPMSQHKQALKNIETSAGLEGLVLRPLSARLMPETIPEKEGWVSRSKLLAFNGRSRKPQMGLAESFNMKDYPCAAGGCLLTDPNFSRRIKDLMKHGELSLNDVELLKIGRHFRISKEIKFIVGRSEVENQRLEYLGREGDYLFSPLEIAGPTVLARGALDGNLIEFCSKLTCYYCDLEGRETAKIAYRKAPHKKVDIIEVKPEEESNFSKYHI